MLGLLPVARKTASQEVGEEQPFYNHEEDEQFDEYNHPKGLTYRHLPEAVDIEP